jgi:hypothetical protein
MPHEPPNLYLDHSVIAHEPWWPRIDAAVSSGDARLAVSVWNLIEIGGATDRKQQERRLEFLERNNPLWIVERVAVQRQEVRRFLWISRFGAPPDELCVFTPHLSVVDGFLSGSKVRVGLTARTFIDGTDFARIEELKQLAPDALRRLQAVDRKTFRKRHDEVSKAWIRNLIPDTDPDGRLLSTAQKNELIEHCAARQDQFLDACPSLAVEDAMTDARTSDPRRKPQNSDGIDLMHTVIALAHCDHFLVRDGFVKSCAAQATKSLRPRSLARVHADIIDLIRDLKPSAPAAPSNPSRAT